MGIEYKILSGIFHVDRLKQAFLRTTERPVSKLQN